MHRVLTQIAIVVLVVAAFAATPTDGAADAGTQCTQVNPATGQCVIYVEVPDQPAVPGASASADPQDTGAGQACYWDPAKQGIAQPPAGPVACTSAWGYWSNTYNCYIELEKPQPTADDPAWQGHQPGDGAIYECYQPQTGMLVTLWSKDAPSGAATGPTPRQVAADAVKQMALTAVRIGIAPKPGPDSVGLVGMPVWMWADNPDDHTVGPISATASAGGITITAKATLLHVAWDMGDGHQVVCDGPGTPYEPSFGQKSSPDCGYTYTRSSYDKPGRTFTVTATSDWAIAWSGAGQTGTIRLGGLSRSTQITIGEAQVLVH